MDFNLYLKLQYGGPKLKGGRLGVGITNPPP